MLCLRVLEYLVNLYVLLSLDLTNCKENNNHQGFIEVGAPWDFLPPA